jgi:hypothetical protein
MSNFDDFKPRNKLHAELFRELARRKENPDWNREAEEQRGRDALARVELKENQRIAEKQRAIPPITPDVPEDVVWQ